MDVSRFLSDNINNLCIYINNTKKPEVIHINNDEKEIETYLSSIYGEGNTSNIIEYHMMDMVYSYNTANDGQRIYRKIFHD